MSGKTTLKDIADEVGVSISAVSRVLNGGTGRISDEKRKRILSVAERLHYMPNQVARSLVTGRSKIFGLVVPSIRSRTYTALIDSLEEMCRVKSYGLFIVNTNDRPDMEVEGVRMLVERGVDAIFLVPSNRASETNELRDCLKSLPIPCVTVVRYLTNLDCDRTYFDNELGGYLGTKHLIENGHKRIAFACDTALSNTGRARLRGYLKAMEEAELPIERGLIIDTEYKMTSGYEAGRILLNRGANAIFAGSDYIALGMRKAYAEAGLRVPEDLSIVAFDYSESDFLQAPSMTAMIQDMNVLAYQALSIVSQRLAGEGPAKPIEIVLPPELLMGGSVANLWGKTRQASGGIESAPMDLSESCE